MPKPTPPENDPGERDETVADAAALLAQLAPLEARLTAVQRAIAQDLQKVLAGYAGKWFGSFEANQMVARAIRQLIKQLNAHIACPTSGKATSLLCRQGTRYKRGIFELRAADKNHAGQFSSSTLPAIKLILTESAPASPSKISA